MPAVQDGERAYLEKDFIKAREIWEPIAEGGDAEAEAWLGALYANGLGVEQDAARAFEFYRRSAEHGNSLAANNVGAMYAKGDGVARDPSQGAAWFLRAAEDGDALAQFNYAVALTKGIGVEVNLAEAVNWYRRAAESGHYPSQARLGYCYAKGLGIANDPVEAFVWLSLASRHGVGLAMTELEGLVKAMSGDQKTAAHYRDGSHHPNGASRCWRRQRVKADKRRAAIRQEWSGRETRPTSPANAESCWRGFWPRQCRLSADRPPSTKSSQYELCW